MGGKGELTLAEKYTCGNNTLKNKITCSSNVLGKEEIGGGNAWIQLEYEYLGSYLTINEHDSVVRRYHF
jgi:hypothetical protein